MAPATEPETFVEAFRPAVEAGAPRSPSVPRSPSLSDDEEKQMVKVEQMSPGSKSDSPVYSPASPSYSLILDAEELGDGPDVANIDVEPVLDLRPTSELIAHFDATVERSSRTNPSWR